jgi:hypothetical protein
VSALQVKLTALFAGSRRFNPGIGQNIFGCPICD